jgi:hypothetical protein
MIIIRPVGARVDPYASEAVNLPIGSVAAPAGSALSYPQPFQYLRNGHDFYPPEFSMLEENVHEKTAAAIVRLYSRG